MPLWHAFSFVGLPAVAMIVQREAEIDGFKPEPIYRLSISCGGITALSDRFEKKQDAENILNVLKEQKTAQVTRSKGSGLYSGCT